MYYYENTKYGIMFKTEYKKACIAIVFKRPIVQDATKGDTA